MTGDGPLRKAAVKEGVLVFGTIGLLDKLYYGEYIDKSEYRSCLEKLKNQAERRLPKDELDKRLSAL